MPENLETEMEPLAGDGSDHLITMFDGDIFSLDDVHSNRFDPESFATALSRLPRFTGHTRWPYTVGQHLIHCCEAAPRDLMLPALLHDAPEAVTNDLSRSVKMYIKQDGNCRYETLETNLWEWMADYHDFDADDMRLVKSIDAAMLATEVRDLMIVDEEGWSQLPDPYSFTIHPYHPEYVRDRWLKLYYRLTGGSK